MNEEAEAPMETTTCSKKPSLAKRRPVRKRYPTSKSRSHPEKIQGELVREKKFNCGNCLVCKRVEDCGDCDLCCDKPKFGGPGIKKQKCELRWCKLKNNPYLCSFRQRDSKKKEKELRSNSDALSATRAERVRREASKQLSAGGRDKTKRPNSTEKKKVKELFITRDNTKTLQDLQNDPDYTPETLPKRMKRLALGDSDPIGSRRHLKCYLCGKEESGRSNLYGHYASSHFKDRLIELLGGTNGAGRRHCEQCKVTFEAEGHMAVHFGRVHGIVEKFLPSLHHIPLTSRGLSMTKARHTRQYDAASEKTEECATKKSYASLRVKETEVSPPNLFFHKEAKRGFIKLGPQKRENTGEGKSRAEEEFSSGNEDLIRDEQELYQSKLSEHCEQKIEHGEYVELYDWKNEDGNQSVDVKDNILADTDDSELTSSRTNLFEFFDRSLDDE